ncbi:MAG: sugar efflux transporter [Stenotrophomonas maltophilia]|uniref:Sugar efflux transporter n=1 Tax=Stenotrophomonas maltophilia TaxID=40324 RepID=A0A7V8FF50_STEMA|nr:MAG: sugar efflux transporter [Stenotrophomonas maltophilia]
MLYTYIAPFAALSAAQGWLDRLLLAFGVASLGGIALAGWGVDRHLRTLLWASVVGFLLAATLLLGWPAHPAVLLGATVLWGLAYGGTATLFQTALARRAGAATDLGQSMLVTGWNLAIAVGGVLGGLLLQSRGAASLPWALLVLLLGAALWLAGRPRAWD